MDNGPRAPYGQPPGWYTDPCDRSLLRWWDGIDWGKESRRPPGGRRIANVASPNNRHADELVPRSGRPISYADDVRRHEFRGEHLNFGSRVADRSARARVTVADVALPGDDFNVDETPGIGLARLAFSVVFGLSLVLYGAGFALHNDVLRLVALVCILFFGVGTTPLQLSERAPLDLRLCVAGLVALSVPLLVGAVMVLVPAWQPALAAVVFGAVAVWVHILAAWNVLSAPQGFRIPPSIRFRSRNLLDASVACSLLGTLLWLAGMMETGHIDPGVLGLLPKAPVYWYLGLILLIAGIVQARGESEWRSAFGVVSLLAALTLTPAVAYGMPRSASAAKHIDLVQSILQMHYLSPAIGIYRPYSGFFDALAGLCDLSAMHNVIGIATYFPFFIDLIVLAGLRFFLGRLTVSYYRIWIAITLSILVNAIGADYFSPQAVGFALAICVFGLALDDQGFQGLDERTRIGLLLLAASAMAVTHELSPYMAGGVLAVLAIFRVIRTRYVPVLILVPAILWALLNWNDVSKFVSLSNIGNLANFFPPKQPQVPSTPGLQRLPIVSESSDALALGLLALIAIAAIGLKRTARHRGAWAFMVSPAVGLALTGVNPYGNEGIFRAALFSIPWLAAVGTQALPKARSPRSAVICGVIAIFLLGTYLVAMFGLDNANVIRSPDYQVMQIYQDTAAPDSYLLDLSYGNNVLPAEVAFPVGNRHVALWGTVITQAQAAITQPTSKDVQAVANQYYLYAKKNDGETGALYAFWSLASVDYAVDYGRQTLAQAVAWRNAMIASPVWRVVYSNDGSYLFRLDPNVSRTATGTKTAT